jgi:hypothetical protein
MSISFKELPGSPVEKYTTDGMVAIRQLICAWTDRNSFVQEILGQGYQTGITTPVAYPGASEVVAAKVVVEPFNEDLVVQNLGSLTNAVNSYRGFAKVTVTYAYPAATGSIDTVYLIKSS